MEAKHLICISVNKKVHGKGNSLPMPWTMVLFNMDYLEI